MLKDLFIVYANNSLRKNPKNLKKIFNAIHPHLTPYQAFNKSDFNYFADLMIEYSKYNDPDQADKHRTGINDPIHGVYHDIAFEAVYRYRDGFCPDNCIGVYGHGLALTARQNEYGGDIRLKCHECRQLYFRHLLFRIISKEGFEKMIKDQNYMKTHTSSGLDAYLRNAYDCINQEIILSNNGTFEKKDYINAGKLFGEISKYEVRDRFDDFISSIVGFSLADFLLNNERQKLKNCQLCNNFFITSKNDSRIKFCPVCSPKSKKTKAENAEYHRQWRLKNKQKKLAKKREALIESYMDRGLTRKEAIETIVEDSKIAEADLKM